MTIWRPRKRRDEPIITFKGKPVGSLKSAWNAAKKRAGITRRLRMYDFRHSFATKLLDNGADLKHVSSLLGHRSIQQTVDTYQHLSKKLSEDAVQRLPSVLSKKIIAQESPNAKAQIPVISHTIVKSETK